jgi:uncharacterized membrane protein
LFAALWAWKAGQRSWLLFFSLLSLLAKEDVSVVLCGFGLMLMCERGWRQTGAALIAMALGAFYFHTQVVTPKFLNGNANSLLFSRYPLLGENYRDFFKNIFREPGRLGRALAYDPSKYWRLLCYLFPTGGLALLSPMLLIPPTISVAPHILSQAGTQLSLADIYSLPAQPFLFVGSVLGAERLLRKLGSRWHGTFVGVLIVVAGLGAYQSPKYFKSLSPERIRAFHALRSLVPPDATLAAQHNLQPHFETRRYIQLFPIRVSMGGLEIRYLENPQFILCDRIGNGEPGTADQLQAALENIAVNPAYEKIFDKENFLVYRRLSEEPMRWKIIGQ